MFKKKISHPAVTMNVSSSDHCQKYDVMHLILSHLPGALPDQDNLREAAPEPAGRVCGHQRGGGRQEVLQH